MMAEAGVADFNVAAWYGVLAPAGLPPAITERLNRHCLPVFMTPMSLSDCLRSASKLLSIRLPPGSAGLLSANWAAGSPLMKAVGVEPR